MKKALSVLMSICMLISLVTVAFAGYKDEAKLQFDENGKFKILVLADVQDDYPVQKDTITFINESLDYCQPDIVVFCGDNIMTEDIRAYEQVLNPIVERDIPFTLVFGNHDDESSILTKEEQLEQYQQFEGCLAYDADPSLHGCATHNLPVLSSDGEKLAFNLWMFDCGDYVYDSNGKYLGYDWVRKDQIDWYNTVREEMAAENDGELVPSMAFQHIIPQEPCEKIFLPTDIGLGEVTFNFADGTHLTVVPDITKYDGYIFEKSCPSYGNDGQWDAMVAGEDVLGVVVGHDHVNNFVADVDGVDLIQTPGVTFESYYNDMVQGARIIEIDESNPWEYTTYNVTTSELAQNENSQLGDDEDRNQLSYDFNFIFEKIFGILYNIFKSYLFA